jgi:hypothetical protein
MADLPWELSARRNRDLAGRARHLWYRRALLVLIVVLPVLALLNVFGQKPTTSHASGPAATLTVDAPERLRSGLIYQARFEVKALRDIHQLQFVLDRGWWEGMSVNSIEPNPSNESTQNGAVTLSFGTLARGETLVMWIYYQTNPTNVGHRSQNAEVDDGTTVLARVSRKVTVYP